MDYTWKELLTRLGLEAQPQIGYYYTPQPHPWFSGSKYITKGIPLIGAEFAKDMQRVGFPNRELMLNVNGGFNEQPSFLQQLLSRRNPLTTQLKDSSHIMDMAKKLGLYDSIEGSILPGGNVFAEDYSVPNEMTFKPTRFKMPTKTLRMMGEKIMSSPITRNVFRASGPTLPVLDMVQRERQEYQQREVDKLRRLNDMAIEEKLRTMPMVLKGSVEYNDYPMGDYDYFGGYGEPTYGD